MSTVSNRVYESTIGTVGRTWDTVLDRLELISPWFVIAAYVVVYPMLLIGGGVLSVYVGALLPGVAGAALFFTGGLVVVAAAPTAAHRMFIGIMDVLEDTRGP